MERIKLTQAVIVEGRDDVRAVREACDALIIPTHGYGIARETWELAEKAYNEKGLIILTDPDYAGEEIRRRMTKKFPDAVQAYIDRGDATSAGDIGVENARPEVIAEAITKALGLAGRSIPEEGDCRIYADMSDMTGLGLAASDGAAGRRAAVCRQLGIGYSNASAMISKLKGFGIDINELREAVEKCK